ncbi:MAG TPA: sulfite reductase subunit alpha, partial [Kiritimatiellia bacterium]
NAKGLWENLNPPDLPSLAHLEFSVLALGDTVYATFCDAGKKFDARLEQLGAKRIHSRVDCDKDYDAAFAGWLKGVTAALRATSSDTSRAASASALMVTADMEAAPPGAAALAAEEEISYSSRNPFGAVLAHNRRLSLEGSEKETRHFEIALDGSGLAYEAGDALGVMPRNCAELVGDVLTVLGCDGEEGVPGPKGETVSLRKALLECYDLRQLPRPFVEEVALRSGDERLGELLTTAGKPDLDRYLWGREVIDLLLEHPGAKFKPGEFVALLRKLQHRLYSISSSPKVTPGHVHLTVAAVRYEAHGRNRKGVCSTFLADRSGDGSSVGIFIQANKGFRPPADGSKPAIMIGPGTGVAPFRAFLQERRATGAAGRNWLFFGDQRMKSDYLYREEFEAMRNDGFLHRLDTAFSRDQAEKIYVQHRMLEKAPELFAWLEEGAHLYVCGDASRMAKDVDRALHEVIATAGGRTPDQAAEYVKRLQKEKRYQRDVY